MTTEILYTGEERRAEFEVIGLAECNLGELTHLAQIIGRIFIGDNIKFGHFLLTEIEHELRSRTDESVERTSLFLSIDVLKDSQIVDACFATCFMRGIPGLSRAEIVFVTSLHQRLQMALAVRLSVAKNAPAKMLDRSDIANILGINDEQVQPLITKGLLPPPVRLSRKTLQWHAQDVYEAIRDLQ